MKIETFSGKVVDGPVDINGYWADRMNHDLYRLMLSMSKAFFSDARSAIDVGCYTSGLLVEMDWIRERSACDIQARLAANWEGVDGVDFIGGDAFELRPNQALYDLVISNQTIEHLDDPAGFVRKLFSIGRGLVISTTLNTPKGLIPGHVQDPIDFDKFKSWFPVKLDCWSVCYHPTNKNIGHIIAVIKKSHPNRD